MKLKKLLAISLLLSLAIWSCTAEPKGEKSKDEPMASGEIIYRYVTTLTTAQGKAQKAAEAVEDRTRRTEEALRD